VTPSQWTAVVLILDPDRRTERFVNMTYDATEERIFLEDRNVGAEREYYWEWLFYKEKMGYRVNQEDRQKRCERFELTRTWRPIGVPENAELRRKEYLGDVNGRDHSGIPLDAYEARLELPGNTEGYLHDDVTQLLNPDKNCVPVIDSILGIRKEGQEERVDFYTHQNIFDVHPRINPDVFNLPANCKQ
jgi:hypothetical protein